MTVSVLVPYRASPEREHLWAWVRARYGRLLPGWELVVSGDGNGGGRFNFGRAFNNAAEKAGGDVYLLACADIAFDPGDLERAVTQVAAGGGWMLPSVYHQLTEADTERLLAEPPDVSIPEPAITERTWVNESVAEIAVVPRDAYWLVGGYDERYPGWGWNDKQLTVALNTLYAPYRRYPGSMYHLWHRRHGPARDCNPALTRRYLAANGDKHAVRKLIMERR